MMRVEFYSKAIKRYDALQSVQRYEMTLKCFRYERKAEANADFIHHKADENGRRTAERYFVYSCT